MAIGTELMPETGSLRFMVGLKALASGYDANGNMTLRLKDGARYFLIYDAENRLTSVSGTVSASFAYNGDGQRVTATIGTAAITTYIGGYYEWKDGVGTSYYFAEAQRIAMRAGAGVEFLLGDHLGSTSLTVDSLGGNPRELRYYPWGEVRWASGTTPTDYRFTGQMEVASIGLYFYNARWYDSYLNRWIQPDSIIPNPGNPLDYDRYSYVRNNPTKYRDPTGHCVEGADDFEDCMEWLNKIEASWDFVNVIVCGGGEYADGCIGWTATEMSLLYDTLSEYILGGMVDDGLISFIRTNSDEYGGFHTAGYSGGTKSSEIRISNGAWTINPLLGIQGRVRF